jgi:hypothetical protein
LARVALGFALLAMTARCADLPDIPAGICGNGVVEPPEDCDSFAFDAKALCRPKGSAGECHLDCRVRSDGTRPTCPDGWGCDADGLCRAPTDQFESPVEIKIGGASSLLTGDFDGDGRADILSREPLDAYGRAKFRFHYFDEKGALTETRILPKLLASPIIADLSGDGRSDVVFTDFRVGLTLGQADRGLVPETFGAYHVPGAKVRMVAVYDELINGDSALFAVTTLGGVPGYYLPSPNGVLVLRGPLPGPFEALVGAPVDGDVFDDWSDSPCREIIGAARGATAFTVVDVCSRSPKTGVVFWREPGVVTTIALVPPAPIDAAPLVADINVDGHPDVLLRAGGQVYVALSDGKHLSDAVPYRLLLANDDEISPDIPMPLAAGDFTGDGAPDFVFADRLLTSSLTPASALPRYQVDFLNLGAPWTEAKIADLNANGKLDVVAASSGRLGIDFFNGSGGQYLTDFSIPTHGPVAHLAVADLDGDLIDDLAFVETAPSADDRDAIMVSFGQLSGRPLAPVPVARVARSEELRAFSESGRGNLIVSSAETVDGAEGGALTLLAGSGDRMPYAPLGLSTISANGQLDNAVALGLSVGSLTGTLHNDLVAFATNDVNGRDWQVWMVRGLDSPASRPERLDWKLDPALQPAYIRGSAAALSWVGACGDVDGDGRDEALWAMSNGDLDHCALVLIGAMPGTTTLTLRSTIKLDEPCAYGQLMLADADGDGRLDAALLTGSPGGAARKLLVLWNEGEGILSSSRVTQVSPSTDSPQAFAFVPAIAGRAATFAYVTDGAVALVDGSARREFAAPRVLGSIEHGTGITFADVNGDGARDLVLAASGNLLLMKAGLRKP